LGSVSKDQAKYLYFTRLTVVGLVFSFSIAGLAFPRPAEAGVLSYLKSLTSKADSETVSLEPQNSQNILFLEAATNIDPNPAKGGGDIVIVDDSALISEVGPSGSIAEIESNDRLGKVSLYVVRSGDSIPQIAKMYNVSENTILWANDLVKGAKLTVGQTLVILPVNGVEHVVKKGDTLKGIAKKYKADVQEIADFNDISVTGKLAVGDTVIVPDGEEAAATTPTTGTKAPTSRTSAIASYPAYSGYFTNPLPTGSQDSGCSRIQRY
jgi:LysM repeat protein